MTRPNETPRVTRDVAPSALGDLLDHPPRATVAFVDRDDADRLSMRGQFRAGTGRFGVRTEITPA